MSGDKWTIVLPTIAACLFATLVLMFSFSLGRTSIVKDCLTLGKFAEGGAVYVCTRAKEGKANG